MIKFGVWFLATVAVFAALQFFTAPKKWELDMLDLWFQWRGERSASEEVVLVLVDEATARYYGGWPLPRQAYADLIQALNRCGAAVIVFDIAWYDRRDTSDALQLASATQQARNVIHAFEFVIMRTLMTTTKNQRIIGPVHRRNLPYRFKMGSP